MYMSINSINEINNNTIQKNGMLFIVSPGK